MMRLLVMAFALVCFYSAAYANDLYLDDVASPQEIGEELGLEPVLMTDSSIQPLTVDEFSSLNGLDVTRLFAVTVVVDKATQRARIYKGRQPFATWKVSTGRDKWEVAKSGRKYFTSTPSGWFSPQKFDKHYYSRTWKAYMDFAVFFSGGVALHATTPDHYAQLGSKASGGCVRLRRDHAQTLYNMILNAGVGKVPSFSRDGRLARDSQGRLLYKNGYRTLILVQ